METANETAPGGARLDEEISLLGGLDNRDNGKNRPNTQVKFQDPAQEKKRGGRASRDKGNRFERTVVRLLQDAGLDSERRPLSGAAGGSYCGVLTVQLLGRGLVVEAKARAATGFARLYAWLEGRDVLVVKSDHRDALCVLPLRLAAEVATAAERRKP